MLLLDVDALLLIFFFFNDTATTEIYTLSLHDALPISAFLEGLVSRDAGALMIGTDSREWWAGRETIMRVFRAQLAEVGGDRKSTRLNSSHANISYAVFCLKKKKNITNILSTLRNDSIK